MREDRRGLIGIAVAESAGRSALNLNQHHSGARPAERAIGFGKVGWNGIERDGSGSDPVVHQSGVMHDRDRADRCQLRSTSVVVFLATRPFGAEVSSAYHGGFYKAVTCEYGGSLGIGEAKGLGDHEG